MSNLILVDDQDFCWVRKHSADCLGFELQDQLKRFKSTKDEIVLGYAEPKIPSNPMDAVSITLYAVYTTDINSHKYYSQRPDWEKTPWIAPGGAVDWAKEKEKYDIIT